MEGYELWIQGGATAVLIGLVVFGFRSLMRGDIVLGREYKALEALLKETAEKYTALTLSQKEISDRERKELTDRIAAQASRLDRLMQIQKKNDEEGSS